MKHITIAILFFTLLSCEKDKETVKIDYRDQYLGNFNFAIITEEWLMATHHYDTTYFVGFVEKDKYRTYRYAICFDYLNKRYEKEQ